MSRFILFCLSPWRRFAKSVHQRAPPNPRPSSLLFPGSEMRRAPRRLHRRDRRRGLEMVLPAGAAGKDATQFAAALAHLAARARASRAPRWRGRTRQRCDVAVGAAPPRLCRAAAAADTPCLRRPPWRRFLPGIHDVMEERLTDNTTTAPAEQAAFRIDFRAWCKTHDATRTAHNPRHGAERTHQRFESAFQRVDGANFPDAVAIPR